MKVVQFCVSVAVLVSGLIFVSCNETTAPTGPSINGRVYDNPTLKFGVTTPAGYQLKQDTTLSGQNCILYGRDTALGGVPNFNIITRANSGVTDAKTLLTGTSTQISLSVTNFAITSDPDTVTIDGKLCAQMTYTWTTEQTMQGMTMQLPMQNKMVYMINNGVDIILTFVDMQQMYPMHESTFDSMINAIEFN